MKQNDARIAALVVLAIRAEDQCKASPPPEAYDQYGQLKETWLILYDVTVTHLLGLYQRIGELVVAQWEGGE